MNSSSFLCATTSSFRAFEMNPDSKFKLNLAVMFAYILPAAVLAGAIGGAVMCRYFGAQVLTLLAWAFAAALGVVVLSLLGLKAYVNRSIRRSPQSNIAFGIARAWTTSRMLNMVAIIAIGLSSRLWLPQTQAKPAFLIFFLWLAGFYFIMLMAESIWLARSLKRLGQG